MMNLKEKADTFSWVGPVVDKLKRELDLFREEEIRLPAEPGGWWHQYVCPRHHTELIFNAAEQDTFVFTCPQGCKLEGEPYRGAWLVYRHQAIARYALQAAAVFAADGKTSIAAWPRRFLLDMRSSSRCIRFIPMPSPGCLAAVPFIRR